MLRIPCPYCGLRDQVEFRCGGEAGISRPVLPEQTSDAQWADYLFYRDNPRGDLIERWVHSFGCGRWFTIRRNTLTHAISDPHTLPHPENIDPSSAVTPESS